MEDEQNKSEKPSPYKLKQAKEKGQVSKSTEFNAVFTLAFFLLAAYMFSESLMVDIKHIAIGVLQSSHDISDDPVVLMALVTDIVLRCFGVIAPFLLLLMLFVVIANVFQIGFIFTAFTMKPDFTKLNPGKNIKKIFSRKTLYELFKSLIKISLFGAFIYFSAGYIVEKLTPLAITIPEHMTTVWFKVFFQLALWALIILAIIAGLDFAYNKWEFSKKMMMSKREVKEEHKKREGDPEIKSKQKQAQKEMLKKSASLSNVKNADVVVTNPTHIAVALQYHPKTMGAPKILAMGKGELAMKIRTLGRRHQVPIVQNKPVARQLYKEGELNGYVPLSCYDKVAPIFRWLFALKETPIHD